nr:uncharacterized protein LOC109156431 isoform X1 [Ipomoea batatas]GMD20890.1 uncharacterized protein LOC109156431 isoform X1 [Ipomoea batatas]GME04035.1 uncharacterized protein LOC109156431 isoform X1 [Ipomoea batatas]GME19216.1 uncharacterized protein LOC109156431 isoform X1 [Ipomoea batatas]GME20178.1 uncharacterized protein LOC109156431 isoform X1 [Ipomoea batatas]
MEEITSLWNYQESMDELKQKLLYTSFELQRLKVESREEMRKNKEYVKQLVQLVNTACRERDEARNQIQKVLSSFSQVVQTDQSPLVKPAARANSGLTESNSLSDAHNHYLSHGSSPVESLLDPVSSPELSSMNGGDSKGMVFVSLNQNQNQPLVLDCNGSVPRVPEVVDQGTLVIDSLVKGKPLPEKGKLLNAVLEAGPLLQTLLLAGPLPRWRNPPQLKHFHIPQVSIRGCDADAVPHNPAAAPQFLNAQQPYFEMSCGSSQMLSTSMLNFGTVPSGGCVGNQMLISSGSNIDCYGHMGKRQRLH